MHAIPIYLCISKFVNSVAQIRKKIQTQPMGVDMDNKLGKMFHTSRLNDDGSYLLDQDILSVRHRTWSSLKTSSQTIMTISVDCLQCFK